MALFRFFLILLRAAPIAALGKDFPLGPATNRIDYQSIADLNGKAVLRVLR